MIIELVGLPGSGKTTIAEAMKACGAVLVPAPSRSQLVTNAVLFWLQRPALAVWIFWLIATRVPSSVRYELLANGYVGYAARYRMAQIISRAGKVVVLDQGFFQLLISLGELPSALLDILPKPDVLAVVEADATVRENRMSSRGWAPRSELGYKERLIWQGNAEASLYGALPLIEKSVRAYRYDGTQAPREGAPALMEFSAGLIQTHMRSSFARQLLKTSIALFSYAVAKLARISRRTPQVAVLMYHSIDCSGWKLAVSPEAFERQMKYLARKGWAVPLDDVVSYANGEKKLPAHAVAITFDDGYCDLLTTVLPILERYRIPATVFVPSDMSVQTGPDGRLRLSEEELRTLAQSPLITVGSHAQTHRKFTELTPEEMKKESEDSAEKLASILGKRPRFFAYPFGARSAEAERAV